MPIKLENVGIAVRDLEATIAARHGCHRLRGVSTYEDIDQLTYVRGPSGIIVMLAQELTKGWPRYTVTVPEPSVGEAH